MTFISKILTLLLLLCACSSRENAKSSSPRTKKETIYRKHDDIFPLPTPPQKSQSPLYPWNKGQIGHLPKITKEYFRCKGSPLNPGKTVIQNGESVRIFDCGGIGKHSLPLRDGKEFIYPILIDLMNDIQEKTGKKIIITSGHRCPQHNTYVDHSPANNYSKHQIGAEVSFYVQGLENSPEAVVKLIQAYYEKNPQYFGKKEYAFSRYEKEDTDVSTKPWFNKEIYIKLYSKTEGRNFDNQHAYPYISLQVRHDADLKEKVIYTWEKANKNYLRN